jgi:hypothetical protein
MPQVKINFKGAEGERTGRPEAKWKSRWHQRAVLIASRLPAFPLLVYHCLDLTSVHEKVNVLQISCPSQGGFCNKEIDTEKHVDVALKLT